MIIKKQSWIVFLALALLLIFGVLWNLQPKQQDNSLASDVGRIYSTQITKIVQGTTTDELAAVIREAAEKSLRVSIAGKRHSQGGHTFYKDAVVVDMNAYNQILNLDNTNKLITVQSGTTWADIQDYIDPYGLSVQVMQSSNIFTIGGSLSVNAHGRDPNFGSIIETVRSFTLLQANGEIINVSRTSYPELFNLVIGGYGLFGIILDVELALTDNLAYEKTTTEITPAAYPAWFAENIAGNSDVGLHFSRLSIVRDETFLREMYATTYYKADPAQEIAWELHEESNITRDKFFYGLSREYDWGKKLRWSLQKLLIDRPGATEFISRNNAMRPPVSFLEHDAASDTDILQEYYIPMANFSGFTEELRTMLMANEVNLLSITIRYVPRDDESFLAYAREDAFAFVLDINHGLAAEQITKAEEWTRQLVDAALRNRGTYYLTYQLYPTREQSRQAYPQMDLFFAQKQKYDERLMFMNTFYATYQ